MDWARQGDINGYCPFEWDAPTEANLAYVALILNVGIDQLGAAEWTGGGLIIAGVVVAARERT